MAARGTNLIQRLVRAGTTRRVRAGVLAAVIAAAVVLVWVAARGGPGTPADGDLTPSTTTTATSTVAAATASPVPAGPTATPFVTEITRVSVARGEAVAPGWGLVVGNALTGGAEVWLMPGGTMPKGISPSGRYFVGGDSLFDGWTGQRIVVNHQGDGIVLASYAPNEEQVYIQNAGGDGRLLNLDGAELARLPEIRVANTQASLLNVVWSADSRGLAVMRQAGPTSRTDVVIDGILQPALASNGMAGWSNSGLRLAVTGDNPAIHDFETSAVLPLERGGFYPSWSGDDRYLAVDISTQEHRGMSAIDARSGKEVLRVYNAAACFDISWAGSVLVAGNYGSGVRAPTGVIESLPGASPSRLYPELEYADGLIRWVRGADTYAEVRVEGGWAASFSWVRRDIDEGFPPVLFLGLAGKDGCIGPPPEIIVAMPPFIPDQVPAATPTPDK